MRGNIGAEIDVIKPALPAQARRLAFPNADESFANALVRARGSLVRLGQRRRPLCKALQPITWCCDSRYDEAGNVIETHEQTGEFNEW
jgi:hypothetical protein